MRQFSIGLLVGVLLFSNCDPTDRGKSNENVEAYVPVYASRELKITGEEPHETVSPGKIYATDRYIFQNDIQNGVHVIDRSVTPAKKIAFIRIPFSTELAVQGNFLYTNYISDLLTIDISDPLQPVLKKRLENVFNPVSQDYPPLHGYFICPDKSKGRVAYWDKQKVEKANCQR